MITAPIPIKLTSIETQFYVKCDHLTTTEASQLLGDERAMRAVLGDHKVLPSARWIKFYSPQHEFCGAVAMCNTLPNPMQVEFHLFYLSTAPRNNVHELAELAHVYSVLNRLQAYTVVQDNPTYRYMINYLRKHKLQELHDNGRIFFLPSVDWKPRTVSRIEVEYL